MANQRAMSNNELASIYDYLRGACTHAELVAELQKSRTNTYYYIGRACDIWIGMGVLKFEPIQDASDLGGAVFEQEENEEDKE